MKKLIIISCLLFFGIQENGVSQEFDCDAPSGFVCGSTLGSVQSGGRLVWAGFRIYYVPTYKECCVKSSTRANACNAKKVGCNESGNDPVPSIDEFN